MNEVNGSVPVPVYTGTMSRYKDDIIRHTCELVRIRSVKEPELPGMRFKRKPFPTGKAFPVFQDRLVQSARKHGTDMAKRRQATGTEWMFTFPKWICLGRIAIIGLDAIFDFLGTRLNIK